MKLGCLDYTFNYLPMPSSMPLLSTGMFSLLNKTRLVKKHRYMKRAIKKISYLGFQGIQIMCLDVKQMPLKAAELKRTCSDARLELSSIGGYSDFFSGNCKSFFSILDYAAEAGADIVCTHSGKFGEWNLLEEQLAETVDYATSRGMCIAIENSPHSMIRTSSDLLEITRKTTGLKVNLDPANLVISGGDAVDAVVRLKKKIVQTHVKDVIKRSGCFDFVALGEGILPYKEYLRALSRSGFRGFLILEYEGRGNPLTAIERGAEYLKMELNRIEK